MNFIGLVDYAGAASNWWENVDLFFFDYRWASMFRQVAENTRALERFIESIWPTPNKAFKDIYGGLQRDHFSYEEISLVGHSEGGLLVRKLILKEAKRQGLHDPQTAATKPSPFPTGLLKADVRLFAPAIAGESLTGIGGVLASTPVIANLIRAFAAKSSMAAESVSVSGTRTITELLARNYDLPCFKAHVLWANKDQVVVSEEYLFDHACANVPPRTNHVNICKPNDRYLLPMTFIENGVVNGTCQ